MARRLEKSGAQMIVLWNFYEIGSSIWWWTSGCQTGTLGVMALIQSKCLGMLGMTLLSTGSTCLHQIGIVHKEQINGTHSSFHGETTLTTLIHPDGTSVMTGPSRRMMLLSGETRFTQKMANSSLSWSHVMVALPAILAVANQVIRYLSRLHQEEALVIRQLEEAQMIHRLAEVPTIHQLVEPLTIHQQEVMQTILHLQVKIQPAHAMTYKLRSLS